MRLAVVAVVSVVVGVFAATTLHSQDKGPLPTQTGFVDVDRVLQEYRKRQTVENELGVRRDQLRNEAKKRRGDIEAKRDRLNTLADGSEESMRLMREIEVDLTVWKLDQEFEDKRLKLEHNQKLGMLYREVCAEVRAQAEERGLAAVYAYDPLPAGFENTMNAQAVIQGRDVLWSDSRLELTNKVIEALNAQLPAPATPAPAPGEKPVDKPK